MPFISIHELFGKQVTIGVWQITERVSDLHSQAMLSSPDRERLLMRKKEKHQKSFLASRILLQQMGLDLGDLYYKNKTIPFLKSAQHISVSHTSDYVVIALSKEYPVGIDIERYHSRITKMTYKFVNSRDNASSGCLDSIKHLTRIWTAKEAMYKAIKIDGASFKNEMFINYENHLGKGTYLSEGHQILCDLYFKEWNDHSLCVCRIQPSIS